MENSESHTAEANTSENSEDKEKSEQEELRKSSEEVENGKELNDTKSSTSSIPQPAAPSANATQTAAEEVVISDSDDNESDTEIVGPQNRKRRKRRRRNKRNKKRKLNSDENILGQSSSISGPKQTSSDFFTNNNFEQFGQNFYGIVKQTKTGLRPIYIDGSNVAFGHGKDKEFSVKGLQICVDFFKNRGHAVKAFIPHFRLQKNQSSDPALLKKMVDENSVITTPTLWIKNERRSPYDDWYIVQTAAINGGIIVSRDGFQDIIKKQPSLRPTVEEFRLVPTWIDDLLMFPMDPLGNRKNDLNEFLKF